MFDGLGSGTVKALYTTRYKKCRSLTDLHTHHTNTIYIRSTAFRYSYFFVSFVFPWIQLRSAHQSRRMHSYSYVFAAAAFAASAFAAPAPNANLGKYIAKGLGEDLQPIINKIVNATTAHTQQQCMPREDALKVAETFQSIIRGYTKEQALAALTPDFVDYSSAVSIIINKGGSEPEDITKPIFTSREEFMQGHGTQEAIPFDTIKVWNNCEGVVTMIWRTDRSGQGQENESSAIPVIGVAVLETERTELSKGIELERAVAGGYNYRIHTLWSEFNTAAWLANNGVNVPDAPVTPIPDEPVTVSKRTKRGLPSSKFDVGIA